MGATLEVQRGCYNMRMKIITVILHHYIITNQVFLNIWQHVAKDSDDRLEIFIFSLYFSCATKHSHKDKYTYF